MMPVEWPLAASAADHPAEPARPRAGRDRLATAKADFFLDDGSRLTDEERALMAAMLRGLVAEVADELIAVLPPLVAARAEQVRDGAYRALRNAALLEREALVALLLRRADEQQLSARLDRNGGSTVAKLVGDEEAAVAEAAMALSLARGRRRDRFGRLGAEFDDLTAEEAVALAYAVAAALREGMGDEADEPLAAAAQALLARHDEGRRLEAAVAAMARALEASGRAGDEMIQQLAKEGDAALVAALLARRAGIDGEDAWNLFAGGDVMMLARLGGCDRATAAQLLAGFEMMLGSNAPEHLIDRFDSIDIVQSDRARRWLRLDPHYRAAREALEQWDG
jgi:hypothetical protein